MCETFLTETTENDALSISGYDIERKDRCETNSTTNNGGGILIYLNSHLNYIRRKDIECNEIESVWVEIRLCKSKPFLLCYVYRPPSSNATWCEHFSKQIEKASTFASRIYILGVKKYDKDMKVHSSKMGQIVLHCSPCILTFNEKKLK